ARPGRTSRRHAAKRGGRETETDRPLRCAAPLLDRRRNDPHVPRTRPRGDARRHPLAWTPAESEGDFVEGVPEIAVGSDRDLQEGRKPMKAVLSHRYGPPDSLSYEEVAVPVPGDHEVLIRVRA